MVTTDNIKDNKDGYNEVDITSKDTTECDVCLNVNPSTEQATIDPTKSSNRNRRQQQVKKTGGGGPNEPKFLPMLLTFVSVLFFTVLNEYCASVMYTDLVHDFHQELTTVQWVTTAFVLVLAIGMVFSSFMAKHIYMRTIFFTSVISFVTGSIICVFAKSFTLLIGGRIVQGIGTALLMPQMSNIIMIMAPEEKLGFYNGFSMLVVFTGSAFGPSLSGLITKYLGWRYVFAILIPVPLIAGVIGYWTVGNIVELEENPLDLPSVILAILGFGGVSYGLGNYGDYGFYSWMVLAPVVVGTVALVSFFVWENYCHHPILCMKGLGSPYFIINILLSTLNDFTLVGWIAVLPFIIQNSLGKNAFISGLALLPGDLMNAILNIIGGKLYDHSRFRYGPLGIAFILMGSLYFFWISVTDRTSLWSLITAYTIGNIGLPLVATIYTTAALTYVPPQSAPHASAIYYSFFQFFSALSSAIYIALLNNFKSVPFNTSEDPLIHGASICFLLSCSFCVITLTVSILWNIIYFRNHDRKGNLKKKK